MNIPYLLKILNTDKLGVLVENLDMTPLDLNLVIGDSELNGEIEVDREKGTVKALKDPEVSFNADLASKLLRIMQQYERQETNITRGRLNSLIKDPTTGQGYAWHDYLTSLQSLIDSGQIEQVELSVPKTGKRPYHKFVFLQFPDNDNEEWNAREVNNWIANWNKKK